MPKQRVWTCQRKAGGVKCGEINPRRRQLCSKCGKKRPATKRPTHMAALDLSYEDYIKINGGEFCGICGKLPGPRRLDRDHLHQGQGKPRGLLCRFCNRKLTHQIDEDWLIRAAKYLQKTST